MFRLVGLSTGCLRLWTELLRLESPSHYRRNPVGMNSLYALKKGIEKILWEEWDETVFA